MRRIIIISSMTALAMLIATALVETTASGSTTASSPAAAATTTAVGLAAPTAEQRRSARKTPPRRPTRRPRSTATPTPRPTPSSSDTPTQTSTPTTSPTTSQGGTPPASTGSGAGRRGWQLTTANTGLAGVGLRCADLPVYTGGRRPAAGTVISQKRIETQLDLSAGGITIDQSCIRPTRLDKAIPVVTTTDYDKCTSACPVLSPTMVTIRDSDIDGSAVDRSLAAFSDGFRGVGTLQRNNIHDVGSGIALYNTGMQLDALVEGNYVHGLLAFGNGATTGTHVDGLTIRDFDTSKRPTRQAVIRNNRVDTSNDNATGALYIQTFGDIDRVLIEGNLLEGQGYQLTMIAYDGNSYGRSMRVVDNRFSGTGWGTGYVDGKGLGYGWSEWRDNTINSPSAVDNRGRVISDPS